MKRSTFYRSLAPTKSVRGKIAAASRRIDQRMDALIAEGKTPEEAARIISTENMEALSKTR